MQLYFIYDCENRTWRESQEEWVKEDMEKIPVKLILETDSQDKIDQFLAENNQHTLFAYSTKNIHDYRQDYLNKYAVARWRVQLFEKQQTAIIIADVLTLVSDNDTDYPYNFSLSPKSCQQFSFRLDYGRGKYMANPYIEISSELYSCRLKNKWDWIDNLGLYNKKFSIYPVLPDTVGHKAMEFLKNLARKEFGFVPTVPDNIPMGNLLKYFVQFPLDVNVGWYADLLGENFKQRINRNNDSNFKLLCEVFSLPPLKSLKKAYNNNCRVMFICYILKLIGVEDINAWQQFYGIRKIMGTDIETLGLVLGRNGSFKDGLFYIKTAYKWHNLGHRGKWEYGDDSNISFVIQTPADLVKWIIERWGIKRTVEIIYPIINEWNGMVNDSIHMWRLLKNTEYMHENIIKHMYRNGFTNELHDILMYHFIRYQDAREAELAERNNADAERRRKLLPLEFSLTPEELCLAEETKYGTFHIARTGADLHRTGKLFENCVFSYATRMETKQCTIYYLMKEEIPLACIEVRGKEICQASGPRNKRMKPEARMAVQEWSEKHGLYLPPKL